MGADLSSRQLEQLIERSPIGIAVIDFDGRCLRVNPAYCALLGRPAAELVGSDFLAVFAPAQRAAMLERHRRFLVASEDLHGEWEIFRRDGRRLNVISESVRWDLPDGSAHRLVYVVDVTELKRVEAVLRDSEKTYRTLFETVPQGIVYQDASGRITSANPAAQRILGLTLDQLQQRGSVDPRWRAVHEDGSDFPGDEHPTMRVLATGEPVKDVVMGIVVPDRGPRWIQISAMPVFKDGRIDSAYACFEDITEQVELRRELSEQATTDYLTGAANRRSFMARLQTEFERLRRHEDLRCALVSIDIDFFKRVNDSWGHAAGDEVLRHLTRQLRHATRQIDLVGRTGGEEFALLLPDTGVGEALGLAERLRAQIAQSPATYNGRTIPFTVSIGVSALLPGDADIEAALGRADRALYEAKAGGRDTVRLALPAM